MIVGRQVICKAWNLDPEENAEYLKTDMIRNVLIFEKMTEKELNILKKGKPTSYCRFQDGLAFLGM